MDKQDIKKAGLKITLPRVKILKMLEGSNKRHVSAEDIHQALVKTGEEVGLATIYRVLTQFEEAGLVKRHRFEDDHSVFELDDGEHHDHIVCVRCAKVEEFVDEVIEARQTTIASKLGYRITDHSLYLYGICMSCQQKA